MALTSTFTDNRRTPAPPATVGFKLSKPGYDANTAAGQNFVFNSSWPSLPVAFEKIVPNPSTAATITVAHNLQMAPFTIIWVKGTDPSGIGTTGRRIFPMVDRTNVYITRDMLLGAGVTSITRLVIRCFQLDLSVDIDYQLASANNFNLPYDPNFGIKVVKPNKDITSRDMRDFALHSRCQSPLILAVKTEATIPAANINTLQGSVVQYTNKLPYPVWVYAYIKQGADLAASNGVPINTYMQAPMYSQAYPKLTTDGFLAYVGYNSSSNPTDPFLDNGATLVILRDPMFAANQVTAQY